MCLKRANKEALTLDFLITSEKLADKTKRQRNTIPVQKTTIGSAYVTIVFST